MEGASCGRMTTGYTHDEYCDLLLPATLELVLPQGNTPYFILGDVIQTLISLADWGNVSVRQKTVNAGSPRTVSVSANEDAVEREPWRPQVETIPAEVFRST
jgi:hypothetical protein